MTHVAATALAWALLIAGSFFLLAGGVGMLRMPDVFTRMHAAGISDTMGAGLVLLGLCAHSGSDWAVTLRLVLTLAFLWFTCPIATHATAKAALAGGTKPYEAPAADDRRRGDEAGGAPSSP